MTISKNSRPTLSAPISLTMVFGGIKSGKTAFAEQFVLDQIDKKKDLQPIYLATGVVTDPLMGERIQAHKAARCFRFKTLEVPLKLETALLDLNHHRYVLLIDCLSVWLTNLIVKNGWQDQVQIKSHIIQLIDCIGASNANIVTISSEVGLSVIGIDAMTRAFIDFNGFMNQKLAKLAKDVFFVQAGLAQNIKSNSKH